MKKTIIYICLLSFGLIYGQAEFSAYNSKAGSFSRLGVGARGMGMGNAMSAVNTGNLSTYYNPALSVFQKDQVFQTAYTFMTLDRSLNFLNFTKKFKLKSSSGSERYLGLSVGIINSGVSDILEADIQGELGGSLSTSENQFYLSLANRFSDKLSVGITFKYLYYNLYEGMTSSGIGIDIGVLYKISDNLTAAFTLTDINSKYNWDSSDLFGMNAKKLADKFPLLTRLGLAYKGLDDKLLIAVDFESSNSDSQLFRIGAEYNIHENLYIRSGIDRVHLNNSDIPARPSFGFSYFYNLENNKIGIDYAFVVEPYSAGDLHVVGVNFAF